MKPDTLPETKRKPWYEQLPCSVKTALICVGKEASGIGAELGSMKVTE